MAGVFRLGLFLLSLLGTIEAQKTPSINIQSKCLGNLLRVDVGPLRGKLLEVSAVVGNSAYRLTQSLATQCGFSMKYDTQETIVIYASIHNCFAQNMGDSFSIVLNLRLYGNQMVQGEVYQVAETCSYSTPASREIICDPNYMEVSVKRVAPDDYVQPRNLAPGTPPKFDLRQAAEKLIDSGYKISTLVVNTPEEKKMTLMEAQKYGYGIANTPTRLVLRSSKSAPDTYIQHVAGVPMAVLQATTIFKKKWLTAEIEAAAACPIVEGSVYVTENLISWFLPTRIDPLISSGNLQLLEVHMGIDGTRLDAAEVSARRYNMTVGNMYIAVHIPIGAPGGFFKSVVQNSQYFVFYVIEPMLELLWMEDATNRDTRYKVLCPITTPPMLQPVQVYDNTDVQQGVFKVTIGPFAPDVALLNITLAGEVVMVTDCSKRGFNLQEHRAQNSSLKFFTFKVPFADRVVLQKKETGLKVYSLQLIFGLVVLPEFAQFSYSTNLNAKLVDAVKPSISGVCDSRNFYILVQHGMQGHTFRTTLGTRPMTQSLAQEYSFAENGTHFSVAVPFTSQDVAFEAIEVSVKKVGSFIKGRLDIMLQNPETNKDIQAFTLTCSFPATLTECLPNGTMTALAIKLESVPSLNPRQLTLADPTCVPAYSNDRYAYFVFTGNTCGTTRKFLSNAMLYENEISLPDALRKNSASSQDEPDYELKIACYYDVNTSRAMTFRTRPRRNEPYAENGKGELQVALRLAVDDSYNEFYGDSDYPISKYLQQPLYFEVELMRSMNPKVSLELESCWATVDEDRTSQPRWNLIINGCANPVDPHRVVFHPVWKDDRVQYPSHIKRFEVQMFAFAQDQDNLKKRLYVHCDVEVCDPRNRLSEACRNRRCSSQDNRIKVQRRATSGFDLRHVSSGCILLK
ncbi:uncharacterized protein LOC129172507 [Dunckerocampus dactyliophorus]|uniref:uncharacterized protein LOC129172507 n=1 Tax=Dunckerocampus dactyliophorus TaxID=161453 RepID=UPI0024068D85|nr:uncharacterized protein LOC129172507 [Dunckerocampus dactyliophorus]